METRKKYISRKRSYNSFKSGSKYLLKYLKGITYFRRDPYKFKKTFFVDVIPRENPNRTHYPPPPYCYHPELFPELAKNNP